MLHFLPKYHVTFRSSIQYIHTISQLQNRNDKIQFLKQILPLYQTPNLFLNFLLGQISHTESILMNKNIIHQAQQSYHLSQQDIEIEQVFEKLYQLQRISGKGSSSLKQEIISDLLSNCTSDLEVQYLIRFLQKKMRVGLNVQSLEKCLENTSEILGYSKQVEYGIPLKPMLAKIHGQIDEGYCDYKYDGERMQIHFWNNQIELFGRSMDRKTDQFRGVCDRLKNVLKEDCILDCEMIWKTQVKFQDYQQLKKDNQGLKFICFDVMKLGQKILIDQPLSLRRKQIEKIFDLNYNVIEIVQNFKFKGMDEVHGYYQDAISKGMEGLILKQDVQYKQGSRNFWIKLKESLDVDLVVVGGYWGKGKRSKLLGAFLLGAIDQQGDIHPITKVGTGLNEDELKYWSERFSKNVEQQPKQVKGKWKPDIWIKPEIVWEIRMDGISKSKKYGMVSLRFPRFVRERQDKRIVDCTRVEDIYVK